MKKIFTLLLALTMLLSLAACADETTVPSGDTSEPQSAADTPVYAEILGDGTGTYEGETDDSGKFTGYGVWIYHNFRYEGYFVDGVPNGEGTLYRAHEPGEGVGTYGLLSIVQGQWIDGLADGDIFMQWHLEDGDIHTWSYNVSHGYAPNDMSVDTIEDGKAILNVRTTQLHGVPPFADVSTKPELAAPAGGGADLPELPTLSSPSQSPDTSTSAPSSSSVPASASDAADISELVFNAQAISLSAKLNGDGTVTYTYKDTSIQPAYVADGEVGYLIWISGRTADGRIITDTEFRASDQPQDDGTLLDMSNLTGQDATIEIDSNGLSITWESVAFDGMNIDDLEMFYATSNLSVGGGLVFDERLTFGTEVLQ